MQPTTVFRFLQILIKQLASIEAEQKTFFYVSEQVKQNVRLPVEEQLYMTKEMLLPPFLFL